jgi:8-oxo-dGTP pyrophosphatase MutT (NUDIX family)
MVSDHYVRTKDAAGFVLFDEQGRVLLVHQTYGEKKWHIPGGVQEEGEAAWETAIREAKEELNINIEPSDCCLSGMYFLPHRNAYAFIFTASAWSGVPIPDGNEIDEITYFNINELPSPMENFIIERIQGVVSMRKPNVIFKRHHVSDYKII